jgi:hypothetical protein
LKEGEGRLCVYEYKNIYSAFDEEESQIESEEKVSREGIIN